MQLSPNPILNFFLEIVTLRGSFNWDAVWQFLFSLPIIQGAILTIILSVVSQFLGTVIGLILYFMRRANLGFARAIANIYIWFFRGTPLVVQILMLYFALPYLGLSRPLRSIDLFGALGFHNIFMDSFIAAFVALSLNEGAYMSEIVRAGIDSIDVGQMEAAKSLGMTYWLGMKRIVLPQAMRVIVPPLGNEFNNMLKTSSLAAFISLDELLGTARTIGDPRFETLELLVTASIWYLAMTTVWGVIQARIERKLGASSREQVAVDNRQWWRRVVGLGGATPAPAPVGTPTEAPQLQGDRR